MKRLVKEWADCSWKITGRARSRRSGSVTTISLVSTEARVCVETAFRPGRAAGHQTAYDHAIQATSSLPQRPHESSGPIKVGAPIIDYSVGTTGAFAISAALYRRCHGQGTVHRHGDAGCRADLQASHVTDYYHSGHTTQRAGNRMRFPESSMHEASDGLVQLAASTAASTAVFTMRSASRVNRAARLDDATGIRRDTSIIAKK